MFGFFKNERDDTVIELSRKIEEMTIDLSLFKNPVCIDSYDLSELDKHEVMKSTRLIASGVCDYVRYGADVMIDYMDNSIFNFSVYSLIKSETFIREKIKGILHMKLILMSILKVCDHLVLKEKRVTNNTEVDNEVVDGKTIISHILELLDDYLIKNHNGQYIDIEPSSLPTNEYMNEYASLLTDYVPSISKNIMGIVKKHIENLTSSENAEDEIGFVTYITQVNMCEGFSVNYDLKRTGEEQEVFVTLDVVYPEFFSEKYQDWLKQLSSLTVSIYYL